jgi:hypothetical protein
MIKKKSGIEIVREIDLKLQPLLADISDDFRLTDPFILRDPPLPLTMLNKEMARIDLKRAVNVVETQLVKCGLGLGSVVASARVKPHKDIAVIPIDHQRKLWDITLIQPKARSGNSPRPFLQVAHSFFESIIKHLVNKSFELSIHW